jgi:hypothetical protein
VKAGIALVAVANKVLGTALEIPEQKLGFTQRK